ncbi:MAG: response regulator [candidate division WOR-3 bacterium]
MPGPDLGDATPRSQPLGRVLVVDDEPDLAELVEHSLRLGGYEVKTAHDGNRALEFAYQEHFDAIILDLMLPGIDGHQICALLKADRRYRNVPIIILSARTGIDAFDASATCGADAHIMKPFDHKVLLSHLGSLLAKAKEAEAREQGSPDAGAPRL